MWFTSDTHFGHERIIELCDRPFSSTQEMNEALISNWNSVVGEHDTVMHLGDAVMGIFVENVKILSRLNGNIHLIPGNHDRVSSAYHHRNPTAYARFEQMYVDQGVVIHDEVDSLPINGVTTLCHYPFEDDRYPELCPEDVGQWLIHGHVHDEWKVKGRQINVGVDVWDYYPVSLDQILELMY